VVIPQAAFHRAARVIVLHAVTNEGLQAAVVHLDWNLDLHLALRGDHQAADGGAQIEQVGCAVEVELGSFVGFHSKGSGFGVQGSGTEVGEEKFERVTIEFYRRVASVRGVAVGGGSVSFRRLR
jgi:hypothetical protein